MPTTPTIDPHDVQRRYLEQLAARQAVLDNVTKTPATLAKALDPEYRIRPHTRIISDAFLQLRDHDAGKEGYDRILLTTPPQIGKSLTAGVWAPLWWLIHHPRHRIVVSSYSGALAIKRGRAIRDLITSHGHEFGLQLAKAPRSADDWSLTTGGGARSVGVGGGLTGHSADCVSGGAEIITPGGRLTVAELCQLAAPPPILSWSHDNHQTEYRRVQATRVIEDRPVVEVVTAAGRVLRCTPDHPVYVTDRGYVPAGELQAGDWLLGVGGMRPVRDQLPEEAQGVREEPESLLLPGLREHLPAAQADEEVRDVRDRVQDPGGQGGLLFADVFGGVRSGGSRMRVLRHGVHAPQELPGQGGGERLGAHVLFGEVPSGREQGAHGRERAALCPLRPSDAQDAGQDLLLTEVPSGCFRGHVDVRALLDRVRDAGVGGHEAASAGSGPSVLLPGVRVQGAGGAGGRGVPGVRNRDRSAWSPVLCPGMPGEGCGRAEAEGSRGEDEGVPTMRHEVPRGELAEDLLHAGLRGCGALGVDDRSRERPVQGRELVREAVPRDAPADLRTRRAPMRGLWGGEPAEHVHARGQAVAADAVRCAPYQRGPVGQPTGEPGHAVQHLPLGASSFEHDAVSVVRRVRGERERVYDIQVEGNRNFFADEILVHNCLICDDPVQDREQAESLLQRDKIDDWWSSVAMTRLSPGAPCVLILTRWSLDDQAGRLLDREGRVEDGGRWKVIHLPAVADLALTGGTDPLGRADGEPLTHPKIASSDTTALRRHWEDKRASVNMRDWHAMFQGDPKPAEGALVTEALLRARRHIPAPAGVERQRYGVAVDPSGGGRDLAGIIGGWLGTDGRLYLSHDASRNGYSTTWAMESALLAAEQEADFVVFEQSGLLDKPAIRTAFDSAWDSVTRLNGGAEADEFTDPNAVERARALNRIPEKPLIKVATAKKGKLLRAEPVAQQWYDDRLRTCAYLPATESEWCTWLPTDAESPGRIDASVYLAYLMLPIPGSEAVVSVSSQLTRDEVVYESQRRQMENRVAQPQMGARIERRPMRPGGP